MLVRDFLEQSAERFPDKVGLVFENERLTYGTLEAMANRLANALIGAGVQRGDRVLIHLANSIEAVVSIFAILKANAVFVMVNPSTTADKLAFLLNNCQASALVGHARTTTALREVCLRAPCLRSLVLVGGTERSDPGLPMADFAAIQETRSSGRPPRQCIDLDLAALIYTSGSTGVPKGVMATHFNVVSVASSIVTYLENTHEDTIMNVLPLAFGYGLYQMLTAFQIGATVVLERGFAYPQVVLKRMAEECVTGFAGVPTIYALILQLKDMDSEQFSHLRYITNAAAALPVEHINRLRQLFPRTRLYSMYGLTECQRVCYLPPSEIERRAASVGVPIPNTEAWIVDEEGKPVGPGIVGELVVRGSHVTRGYWENPQETALRFRPGRLPGETVLYTGDLFKMDEDGYLYFVSRKDDIIKSRGEKVSPKEVENVLYALAGVAEAAVVGVPDPVLGEAVKAVIVPVEGRVLTVREVIAHCRRHLEDNMVPVQVEFRSELPKTESGKIRKASLRPGRA